MNFYILVAIIGLISIISGTFLVSNNSNRGKKYIYPFLILGGICLEIYSIYLGDLIFIILQGVFIISSLIGFFRVNLNSLSSRKCKEDGDKNYSNFNRNYLVSGMF